MMSYRNGTNDEFFRSEHRDEEPSNNVPEEEHTCELSATMSNNDDHSEEKKEDRVLTPEEEEDAYDAWYEAEFGNCPCLVIPEEKMILGPPIRVLLRPSTTSEMLRSSSARSHLTISISSCQGGRPWDGWRWSCILR